MLSETQMGEIGEQWKTKQIFHMSIACSDGGFFFRRGVLQKKKHEYICMYVYIGGSGGAHHNRKDLMG